jgi:hypothetical protein
MSARKATFSLRTRAKNSDLVLANESKVKTCIPFHISYECALGVRDSIRAFVSASK